MAVLAKSEDEFLEILRKIFGAKKTKRVINGLWAQISPEPVKRFGPGRVAQFGPDSDEDVSTLENGM